MCFGFSFDSFKKQDIQNKRERASSYKSEIVMTRLNRVNDVRTKWQEYILVNSSVIHGLIEPLAYWQASLIMGFSVSSFPDFP